MVNSNKKYSVSAAVHGSKYIGEFLAKNAKEAEKMAWDSNEIFINICHQCSSECEDAEVFEVYASEVKNEI